MQRHSSYAATVLACSAIVFSLASFAPESEEGPCDSPLVGGHTGAPGETSCTGCHGGTANTGPAVIEWGLGDAGTYVPGTQYTSTVTIKQPGRDKFGFSALALRDAGNANLGGFGLVETIRTRTYMDGARDYVSHTPCGADAPDSIQWTFTWQAPATDVGTITIYMAALVANHSHSLGGDDTHTRTITLSPSSVGIEEGESDRAAIRVFPNPANDQVSVSIPITTPGTISFELRDAAQRTLRSWRSRATGNTLEEKMDLGNVPAQLLQLHVISNGERTVLPIMHE